MNKKIIITGSFFVLTIAILAFYLTKEFQNKEANISATIVAHNFSSEGEKIKLGFVKASATKETLTVTLSITGIDLYHNSDAFSNLVCNPYITSEEAVKKTFISRSGEGKDPTQITYVYDLSGNTYQTLHVELDWTIGPCGHTDAMESNATPSTAELMTNYHFSFVVPVK
jgi:hypothetical protein